MKVLCDKLQYLV